MAVKGKIQNGQYLKQIYSPYLAERFYRVACRLWANDQTNQSIKIFFMIAAIINPSELYFYWLGIICKEKNELDIACYALKQSFLLSKSGQPYFAKLKEITSERITILCQDINDGIAALSDGRLQIIAERLTRPDSLLFSWDKIGQLSAQNFENCQNVIEVETEFEQLIRIIFKLKTKIEDFLELRQLFSNQIIPLIVVMKKMGKTDEEIFDEIKILQNNKQ